MFFKLRVLFILSVFAILQGPAWAVEDLGAHRFRGMEEFQEVIEKRCTVCHTRERVDIAIRKRRSLEKLEQQMTERGAVLTERDREVLGTFWGSPLKPQRPEAERDFVDLGGYREFERIIETRCVLCHNRDRIDEAIEKRLPYETIEEIMLKRGAILTEQDREVLRIFWDSTLKKP